MKDFNLFQNEKIKTKTFKDQNDKNNLKCDTGVGWRECFTCCILKMGSLSQTCVRVVGFGSKNGYKFII